ncbi:ATP-binding protein [Cyanobacteria bacterium FACHB-DQ100]|nr:ATP-binding protein [Cyanobacteria bacterium FACHB-DQ100]
MTSSARDRWLELNQHYLMMALTEVRQWLELLLKRLRQADLAQAEQDQHNAVPNVDAALNAIAAEMQDPPAIEQLCEVFGLTPFERKILLLCAGVELDSTVAALCAAIQEDSRHAYATFGLALSAFPASHWSALYPNRPLRRWRLVELANSGSLTRNALQIDERVLHYLTGGQDLDARLTSLVDRIPVPKDLVPSHQVLADQIAASWVQTSSGTRLPIVQLSGEESGSQRAIASRACASLGLDLYVLSAQNLPLAPAELEALVRLWEREAAFSQSALLLDCRSLSDASREPAIAQFMETLNSGLILASAERRQAENRTLITIDVHSPTSEEQQSLWEQTLKSASVDLNGTIPALVAQFDLSAPTIRSIGAEAQAQAAIAQTASEGMPTSPNPSLQTLLWNACRAQSRPRLAELAQWIAPAATWEDLVLPEPQKQLLREIAIQVRHRNTVYERWGFASKGARGLGISALFSGLSGTGKTMAAEVLANELQLDLYRIDLSSVVSKYIGETEKNLRRVFDAAEQGGAILLFDEADALFGKRSEVKDSHDRYANIEVSYLLQRMEAYRGLAILTTNLKNALDTAFLRRIRFIVQFPYPDVAQRAEIWQHIFPAKTPTEALDVQKLARLNASGGNIRNIAVYAAFLAAEEQESVRMKHLLRAARMEFAKFEKTPTEAEIQGWV